LRTGFAFLLKAILNAKRSQSFCDAIDFMRVVSSRVSETRTERERAEQASFD
jgi:hypothetical protein